VPFGQIEALALKGLVEQTKAEAVRVSPWKMLLLEGANAAQTDGFITTPDDPLMDIDACPGAPYCPQATVETRAIARQLAPRITGSLHVSGCVKGCARASPADITLVGHNATFNLVNQGHAGDEPAQQGLTPETLKAMKF
jgi:precorrin-3B synthase